MRTLYHHLSEARYTPGPWTSAVPKHEKHKSCRWILGHGKFIAKVYGGTEYITTLEETEANAKLITAVPDLLAACENILEGIIAKEEHIGWGREQMLRAAITKAKREA